MKNKKLKMLVCATLATSLLASIEMAHAAPTPISVLGKDSVSFTVSGLSNATGFGGHFSTGPTEDGYGGLNVECHFIAGTISTPNVTLLCYDGWNSSTETQNQFKLELGTKKESSLSGLVSALSHATFTISKRGIQVDVTRIAVNSASTEKTGYTVSSFFPLRENTGFFRSVPAVGSLPSTIYFEKIGSGAANGVLNGNPTRIGTGYVIDTPIAR